MMTTGKAEAGTGEGQVVSELITQAGYPAGGCGCLLSSLCWWPGRDGSLQPGLCQQGGQPIGHGAGRGIFKGPGVLWALIGEVASKVNTHNFQGNVYFKSIILIFKLKTN